jgi:hypothetical protein
VNTKLKIQGVFVFKEFKRIFFAQGVCTIKIFTAIIEQHIFGVSFVVDGAFGATTFSITVLSIMTFSIMALSIMTFSKMVLSIMTSSIMALSITKFSITALSIMTA